MRQFSDTEIQNFSKNSKDGSASTPVSKNKFMKRPTVQKDNLKLSLTSSLLSAPLTPSLTPGAMTGNVIQFEKGVSCESTIGYNAMVKSKPHLASNNHDDYIY